LPFNPESFESKRTKDGLRNDVDGRRSIESIARLRGATCIGNSGKYQRKGKGSLFAWLVFLVNFLGALASGMNQPIFISQKTVQPEQ